ncbi:hypothetical protein CW354_14825 [Marinicaulis flavus]|uniref:Uncharacterized protein n=1 Tax=Hyphococcus luteus TaxID=2058213 RepID=A0A2S7K2P8_9PROT|nr:hypothetical protein CW354_14825 [Marinicaulis flavus]
MGGAHRNGGAFGLSDRRARPPDRDKDRKHESRRSNRFAVMVGDERENADLTVMLVGAIAVFGGVGVDKGLRSEKGDDRGDKRRACAGATDFH